MYSGKINTIFFYLPQMHVYAFFTLFTPVLHAEVLGSNPSDDKKLPLCLDESFHWQETL